MIFWIIVIGMLIKVIIDFYHESRVELSEEIPKEQLVVMTSCEEESNYKYLQQLLEEYFKKELSNIVDVKFYTSFGPDRTCVKEFLDLK